MTTTSNLCYIGLGSNLSAPVEQLQQALHHISAEARCSELRCSSLYASKPMGPQDQPDYVNAVARLIWQGSPIALLDTLQRIELEQGRVRKAERWGPRTLDLDILLFADQVINTQRLTVPHYGMKQREFVLYPLRELSPELTLPDGSRLLELIQHCPINDLQIIKPANEMAV